MSGKPRYAFTHGIVSRKSDIISTEDNKLITRPRNERISLTFRKSVQDPCSCEFPKHCPAQGQSKIGDENANQLEKLHVHEVYEKIAEHFSETRHKPWPKVMEFLQTHVKCGDVLVDIGCGNGKYLGHLPNVFQIGLDYSRNLLNFVTAKGCQAIRSDALKLPLNDNVANACINIAVIHHLSTLERRMKAVREMYRVLKPGGHCLVYAWAKDQNVDAKPSTYLNSQATGDLEENHVDHEITTEAGSVRLPVHENRKVFKHPDLLVPWTSKDQSSTLHRFYHVFEENELEKLIRTALAEDKYNLKKIYYDQGNWCCVFQKC